MNKEEFEAFAKEHLEAIRGAWNEFCAGTAWEERDYPLCMSVFQKSVYFFCMDDSGEYITQRYEHHS